VRTSFFARLVTWFIPPELSDESSDDGRRARLLVVFSLTVTLMAIPTISMFIPQRAWTLIALAGTAVTAFAAAPLLLRRTRSVTLAANVMLASSTWGIASVAILNSGHRSPALVWTVIIPLCALMLAGRRSAFAWTGGLVVFDVVLFALEHLGVRFPNQLGERGTDIFRFTTLMAVVSLTLAFAMTYEWFKERMRAGLDLAAVRLAEALDRTGAANKELRLILDNVEQGLLTVDAAGVLAAGRSAVVDEWFGPLTPGLMLWEYLRPTAPETSAWLEMGWEALGDGFLPCEVVLMQLPARMVLGSKVYELSYRPFRDESGQLVRVLVVISDVTAAVARARAEATQVELVALFSRLMEDREGVLEFLRESDERVGRIRSGTCASTAELMRELHTLKGNCALFGLSRLSTLCHELESQFQGGAEELRPDDVASLANLWDELAMRLRAVKGPEAGKRIELDDWDYDSFRSALLAETPHDKLLAITDDWRHEPTSRRLDLLAEQTRVLARRLDKGEIDVVVEHNGLRLPHARWAPLWSAFVHAVRNAVDHGLELPNQRGGTGSGKIVLSSYLEGDDVVIEVADNGRGIDWEKVRMHAQRMGLPDRSEADLVGALFHDGLSTRLEVTEISGRGVGLAAVGAACEAMGGRVNVLSYPERGTKLQCRVSKTTALSTHTPTTAGGRTSADAEGRGSSTRLGRSALSGARA
jgi:HPt (histidine-containing phosphotransfer) domain-containing protein